MATGAPGPRSQQGVPAPFGTRGRERSFQVVVAVLGATVVLSGIGEFVWRVMRNGLDWHPEQSARDYYLEIGRAYSQGFAAGFFLCFFLVLLALAVAPRWRARQRPRDSARAMRRPARAEPRPANRAQRSLPPPPRSGVRAVPD